MVVEEFLHLIVEKKQRKRKRLVQDMPSRTCFKGLPSYNQTHLALFLECPKIVPAIGDQEFNT
jgi:hypothetical protein